MKAVRLLVAALVVFSGAEVVLPVAASAACGWPSSGSGGYVALDPPGTGGAMTLTEGTVNAGRQSGWVKHSAPTIADLNGDGRRETIVGSLDGKYYVFDQQGCRWPGWPRRTDSYSTPAAAVNSTAAVGDLDRDGSPDIVGASGNGWVFAWRQDGSLLPGWPQFTGWNGDYPGNCAVRVCSGVWASPTLGDIDADGSLDVAVGGWGHKMWVWHAWGAVHAGWPRDVWDGIASSAAIDDLDGDGWLDVVFGSDTEQDCGNCQPYGLLGRGGKFHAMRPDGWELPRWVKPVDAFAWSSPVIADVNLDGWKDVVTGTGMWPGDFSEGPPGNGVYAFDRYGDVIWQFRAANNVIGSPALGDLDGNGTLEVAFGDISGWLYLLDARNGGQIWRTRSPIGGNSYYNTPAFGDVTGDGDPEVVAAGSNDGVVRAWNRSGQEVWSKQVTYGIFSTPTLGDLDGTGRTWVVVATGLGNGPDGSPELKAGTGAVWAFKTNGQASAIRDAGFHQRRSGTPAANRAPLGPPWRTSGPGAPGAAPAPAPPQAGPANPGCRLVRRKRRTVVKCPKKKKARAKKVRRARRRSRR